MNIKVVIDDGIIRFVLKDFDAQIHVEIVDTTNSYKDSPVEKYAQSIFHDPDYVPCDYSVADFEEFDRR